MTIRFRLRALMKKHKIGQSQLARETGLSFATIHRLYQDTSNQVSFKTLDALMSAFERRGIEIELTDLIDRST